MTTVTKLTEGYGLIEGPVWLDDRGLIFSDVLGGGVFCLSAGGDVSTVFAHRRGIGGMSAHAAGGMVVSGRNIAYKSFAGDETVVLLDRDPENDLVGFNDITTDATGRVYAGSLANSPVFDDGRDPQSGNLYMIDLDGSVHIVGRDVRLTNGLGFSPDGQALYHADTARSTIYRYDVHADGTLGEKRGFVEEAGVDGLAVSADGAVWSALASSGRVAVFNADGTRRQDIEIPLPMCTSVCFGGPDLQDLYIVSGSNGASSDRAGAVFHVRADVPGLPVPPARVRVDGAAT